ncbi:MAG: hypothetical protein L6271_05120 [Desulfobacteraceae bacterium]|nr:hypothetical protein [Desulfobacteraceae bacterium]
MDSCPLLMFGPSPCPGHYPRRWATMASDDSCFLTRRITPHDAAQLVSCLLVLFRISQERMSFHRLCRDIGEPVARR